MRQETPNLLIIFAIIIVAIVLAFGLFLTLLFIQGRPPVITYTIPVEGQDVTISMNPDKEVVIVGNAGLGGETAVIQPTAPPPQPLPTDTPPPPLPPPPTNTPIPPTPTIDQHTFISHVVTGGDTLFSIANQYNTTIPLMARFGVSSANLIPGNVISVAVANPAYCPGRRTYVVREGDSALSISSNAGISVEEFRQINNLDANFSLKFTNVVCLP
jgi:LysM repeat protein